MTEQRSRPFEEITAAEITSTPMTEQEASVAPLDLLQQAEKAAKNLRLTLRAPQELWVQREEIVRREARVREKLAEMPEIARAGRRRVLREVRAEIQAPLWEGLTAASIDQLREQGVLSPEEADEANRLYEAVQVIEKVVAENRENAAEGLAQRGQVAEPPAHLTREETVAFLLAAGQKAEARVLQTIYEQIASREAKIEAWLDEKRQEVQAAQEEALEDVTSRYAKAAQALQRTLDSYAQDLERIEAVPAVRARLAEIQAEQERQKEREKAEQALMVQLRSAADSVSAKQLKAFEAAAKATDDPEIAQKLGQARRGELPYPPNKRGEPGPQARQLWAETARAVYARGVPRPNFQPWMNSGATRNYETDRLLVVGPEARGLVQGWLGLPEDDPRHTQAEKLAALQEKITEDDLILYQLGEEVAAYDQKARKKRRTEELRRGVEATQRVAAG